MALSAVGGIFSMFGAAQSGAGQEAMYNYQAGVAKINAQIAQQNADYATAAGEVSAQTSGMGTRAQIGTEKTQQSASGLDVNSGSAVDVRASTAELGQHDEATIRANAARTAYGYQTQKTGFLASAAMDSMAASNTHTATDFAIGSSLLGGATSVSDKWMKFSNAGLIG
jgi:hypothetical protein